MSELIMVPNSSVCEFDPKSPTRKLATWADQIIQEKRCTHVARARLLPRDGMAYAVLDARCYDKTNSSYRCNKKTSETLFLLAWRFSSSTRTLKSRMTIDGTPRESVRIKGSMGDERSQIVEEFVLHPASSQEPTPDWRQSYAVSFSRSDQPIPASIDVSFAVRLDKPKWKTVDTLDLAVTVPPLGAQLVTIAQSDLTLVAPIEKEAASPMDGMTAVVVGESIKLLMKEGWDFLKKIAADGKLGKDELIQLNIGNVAVPTSASEEVIQNAVNEAGLAIPQYREDQLRGLNEQLRGMSAYSRNLRTNLAEATTKADKADLETKIEINDAKIGQLLQQIWSVLQQTANVHLSAGDRKAG